MQPHHSNEEPFARASMPATPEVAKRLAECTAIFLVLDQHTGAEQTASLIEAAAVMRFLEISRKREIPALVHGFVTVNNSLHPFFSDPKRKEFMIDLREGTVAGQTVAMIGRPTITPSQQGRICDRFLEHGASIRPFLPLEPDEVPIGRRNMVGPALIEFARPALQGIEDPILSKLLHASAVRSESPLFKQCEEILSALTTLSRSNPDKQSGARRWEMDELLEGVLKELARGGAVGKTGGEILQLQSDADDIAAACWSAAKKIRPDIAILPKIPRPEKDALVGARIRALYMKDPGVRIVLEHIEDPPATSLSMQEALAFERRLSVGEEPATIVAEMDAIFTRRRDTSSSIDLSLSEMRKRDPRTFIETQIESAKYRPDADGRYIVKKSPDDLNLAEILERAQIPTDTPRMIYMINVNSGRAEPLVTVFQARYLQRFCDLASQ